MKLTEATTRDQLEAAVKEALTPRDLAMVEQLIAAIDEGMRVRSANRLVAAFEPLTSAIVQEFLGGQAPPGTEYMSPYREEVTRTLRLRVSGGYPSIAEVEPFTPTRQGEAVCLHCTRVTDEMSYLDIPCGRVIIEMSFCPECSAFLDSSYGPLEWNLRYGPV